MVASPSILISEYPGETDKLIGYFEAFSGLGLLVGPILGSLFSLYSITKSFFICSAFYVFYTGVCFLVLRDLKTVEVKLNPTSFRRIVEKPVSAI